MEVCDAISCPYEFENYCDTCSNPICLAHTNVRHDVNRKTKTIHAGEVKIQKITTTVSNKPMCPDCWWIHRKPFVARAPRGFLFKYIEILPFLGLLLILAGILALVFGSGQCK